MEKKDIMLGLKTFEEFTADTNTYYDTVLGYFKEINAILSKGVKRDSNGMVIAGDWRIEGMNRITASGPQELYFHNINGSTNINVDVMVAGRDSAEDAGIMFTDIIFDVENVELVLADGAEYYAISTRPELITELTYIMESIVGSL